MDEDFLKLLNYGYFFLKFRPRSDKEVRDYLYKKIEKRHWSRDDVEKVIVQLKEEDLVNDKNFVSWFVEQRNAAKPKSEYVLRGELLRFGIAKDIIDDYFLNHKLNEEELAMKALTPKWRRFQDLDKRERFQKAANFLGRRGFSFEVIRKTIEKFQGNE